MKFQFAYQFKRGDTCDYCGTVFGYPLCGLAIVDKELALSARAGLELSAQALEKARNIADNYAAGKICPKCGRPTPEAYVSACRRGAIFYAWAAPLLGGFLATRVFEEEPAFFYGCAAWAFCWAWFRIYLAWPFRLERERRTIRRASRFGANVRNARAGKFWKRRSGVGFCEKWRRRSRRRKRQPTRSNRRGNATRPRRAFAVALNF